MSDLLLISNSRLSHYAFSNKVGSSSEISKGRASGGQKTNASRGDAFLGQQENRWEALWPHFGGQ